MRSLRPFDRSPSDGPLRSGWGLVVLRLPRFGPQHVWVTVSRHPPGEYITRCARARTPTGITVTAGGAEIDLAYCAAAGERRSRRSAEAAADDAALALTDAGRHVLGDPATMARLRRTQRRRDLTPPSAMGSHPQDGRAGEETV